MKKGMAVLLMMGLLLAITAPAWGKSGEGEPMELRNLAAGLSYTISQPADDAWPDSGNELTDGNYGSSEYWDPAWTGHLRGITREVTFDLGEMKSIASIRSHFLQDSSAGIFYPNTVSYYVSTNGVNWGTLARIHTKIPLWQSGPPTMQDFVWDGAVDGLPKGNPNAEMVYARYVKVTFTSGTWVFLDEIEIWGADGRRPEAKQLPPSHPQYLKPGEATAGIRNMVLLYNGWYENGAGDWSKEQMIPYLSYVDSEGNPQDTMFDGVLMLGLWTPNWSGNLGTSARLSDWQWYLEKTFASGGDLDQLQLAAMETAEALALSDYRTKVVLALPFPSPSVEDFGDVDGDGISENFSPESAGEEHAYANRQKAVQWYMNEVLSRWNDKHYSHLELSGLYWIAESVGLHEREDDLIQWTSGLIHKQNLKFFWIPYFFGNRNYDWETLGFDAAVLQPNHFFDGTLPERVQDAAQLAKQYGMGVEMEFDSRINTDPEYRQRYMDYLNGGVEYGYMTDAFKAYYQGNHSLLEAALSQDPDVRSNYDLMYQFLQGTYIKQ